MSGIPVLLALWLASVPGSGTPVDAGTVAQAISLRRSRVRELRAVKEAAEELGVRVWLFGGTAAGFAHYVRWDLAREAGDSRYRETFFDYDFTNIYRSTQDADLVVDGSPQQAEQLEDLIKQKMSFLQGSKEHWEVRLLRQDRVAPGGQVKQALLHNPDFLGQHTDSNSTGMIELTEPPPGQSVVRDLRDWESREPFFLKDVTRGRLHYYWSPTHRETRRFRSGDNPELFSVIRYLVKAFQYHLQVDGEDLARVKAIIEAFDPARDYSGLSPWAQGWLERYGPNLIRHSVDVEYAWNTLEELGLRQKLISLSHPGHPGSLGWWLSREPLRTTPVGEGEGRTVAELGIDVVAHATGDFLGYESITRDLTLRPNVLVSRPGQPGETAALGPGFYTLRGLTGRQGSGFTVRFRVDPRAREGADFTLPGDVVLFTNRAALQVIPESLDLSLLEYFRFLQGGLVERNERGAWMKLRRRLALRPLAEGEERQIVAIVREALAQAKAGSRMEPAVLTDWFSLPVAKAHPELLDELRLAISELLENKAPRFGPLGWWYAHGPLFEAWFGTPESLEHPELVNRMIEWGETWDDHTLVTQVLTRPGWSDHPELVEALIRKGTVDRELALYLFGQQPWDRHPELFRSVVEKGRWDTSLLSVLRKPLWRDHPELLQMILDRSDQASAEEFVRSILTEPHWSGHPEWVAQLIEGDQGEVFRLVAERVLSEPRWKGHPELVRALVRQSATRDVRDRGRILAQLLRRPHWRNDPVLRGLCQGQQPAEACLRRAERVVMPPSLAEQVVRGIGWLMKQALGCR